MKIQSPPSIDHIEISELIKDLVQQDFAEYLHRVNERYFYWDELKHKDNAPYGDPVKAWALVKLSRVSASKMLYFGNHTFLYCLTENIQKNLHEFDLKLVGGLYKSPISKYESAEYLTRSLMEEAIASSQVEGAATTTKVAIEMLQSNRKPKNESEQMISNNLKGIQYISEQLDEDLSFGLIIEIHRIMTANTDAEYCAGSFREGQIYVQDHVDGEIAHTPPSATEANELMSELVKFVNSDSQFIHPIVKASIIHFMVGYIHPFMDGNGRTARALFYWYLMKQDYVLIRHISISRAILKSRVQYDKAFLKTEHDDNDLTYFINYSIKSLRVAFESLIRYRDKKKSEKEQSSIIAYNLLQNGLNKRQADLIGYLYVKEGKKVKLQGFADKHEVVRQTARSDVNELIKMGLITEFKEGRELCFTLVSRENVNKFLSRA